MSDEEEVVVVGGKGVLYVGVEDLRVHACLRGRGRCGVCVGVV